MKKLILLPALLMLISSAFAQSDTALWLRHPAISPDGKTIAFGYMGDIYTVAYQGGEARRLTVHEAYESDPVWSPDGTQLAFASHRHGNADVFTMPARGGEPKRLTFHSAGDVPYSFNPDGTAVLFGSTRLDHHKSVLFPSRVLPELYSVPTEGGRAVQILTTPAIDALYSPDGNSIIYHDQKGYEDEYRKHQTSSVARDIWLYNTADSTHRQLTSDVHEDRSPIFAAGGVRYFYLSERSGSFNIWKAELAETEGNPRQLTTYDTHPVRSLSISNESVLCYSYNGEIYTTLETDRPRKVEVIIRPDRRYNESVIEKIDGKAGDYAVSPNGKEIAFITRGEVFVTSVEFGMTKRITDTPEQERNLHFNSDGTKLLYSSERNGSWNIYEASAARPEEKYFYNATLINETPIVETDAETFQGKYSPDDSEVAFFEERTTLRVKNLKSGEVRTVLPGTYNYSYSDGDQYYTWSPDSKWLLVEFFDNNRWEDQVGLVKATGKEDPVDLTQSGYGGSGPKFGMNGDVIYYTSSKDGYRSHGSWGSQSDVYALFLNEDAYQRFKLSKADYALWKENRKEEKKAAEKEDDKKKKKKDEDEKAEIKPLDIEWDDL
ncbi:MAG: peptidase S41, partial [Flavobacteriales bacterium]|nr:peptidase S41 [Flavobacteriales bacterium]